MTQAYPLHWPHGWPRTKATDRKAAKFGRRAQGLSIAQGIQRVRYELQRLGLKAFVDDAIVSSNLMLNLNGWPRSDQREPADCGIAVYWQKPGEPMRVMAIDAYTKCADNLAAIAATLEAMRAIERHGGAQILDRAFTGFTALPAPGRRWYEVLGVGPAASADQIRNAYRSKAADCHPDRGGSDAAMSELNIARDEGVSQLGGR